MRILKNQTILQRQSDNYIRGELSNVSAAYLPRRIKNIKLPQSRDKITFRKTWDLFMHLTANCSSRGFSFSGITDFLNIYYICRKGVCLWVIQFQEY